MKYDLKDKVVINNEEEINKLNKEFEELNEKFSEKTHASLTEEMHRTISTSLKAIINFELETVFNKFLDLAAKDINGNLEKEDLVEDSYYYSKRGGKQVLYLSEFIKNQKITIEWFSNDHKFTRTVEFKKKRNSKTKIKLYDSAKGMEAVWGFMSNYKKATYQLEVKKTFNIQVLQICIALEEDENKKNKLIAKLEKLKSKKK